MHGFPEEYMSANPKPEGPSRTGHLRPNEQGPLEKLKPETVGGEGVRFLTRDELAEALKISVRTVDTMVAGGEIPHLRIHGNFIRFYLPDVVCHLTATALISKRRCAGPARREIQNSKPETREAMSVERKNVNPEN